MRASCKRYDGLTYDYKFATVVEVAHAGVDPGAVMVHLHDAAAAPPAVMGPRRLVSLALAAVLQLRPRLLGLGAPAHRDKAGAVAQGAREVVQRQTGET